MDTKRKNKGGRNYKKKYATDEERAAAQRARRAAQPVGPTGRLVPSVPRVEQDAQVNPPPGSPETAVVPDNTERLLELIDSKLDEGPREEIRKNLWVRRLLLEAVLARPWLAARIRKICERRIDLFVNWFGWQFNPKRKPRDRVGPFVLWQFQKRALMDRPETTGRKGLLWCIENMRPAVVRKSRELGASWLVLFLQDSLAVFQEHTQIGNVSRNEKAVDSKSPNSLFWKLRFIHKHLPAWLVGPVEYQRRYFGFEWSQSTIDGEASTAEAYSGGRASLVFVDEAAKIKNLEELRQSLASVTDCVVYNSTHKGSGTAFHQLSKEPSIVQITMHWTQHPEKNKGLYSVDERGVVHFWEYIEATDKIVELPGPKDPALMSYDFVRDGRPTGGPHPGMRSPWYDAKVLEIGTARAVAEDLDIDPAGSQHQPFDHAEIYRLKQHCRPPVWEGDAEVDEVGRLVKLIERRGGPLKLWVRLENGEAPKSLYANGNDVSAGTGATPSCASFANMKTGQKVARYANAHIAPDKFGLLIAALCRFFCDADGVPAKSAWENLGGPGVLFGKALMQTAGHRHIYEMGEENPDDHLQRGKRIRGYRTTGESKNSLITQYIVALHNSDYANYDEESLDECLEFRYDAAGRIMHSTDAGKNPEAARENHGDLVIADALCSLLVVSGGRLAHHKRPEPPTQKPEDNILTVAGRQAARRRQQVGGW